MTARLVQTRGAGRKLTTSRPARVRHLTKKAMSYILKAKKGERLEIAVLWGCSGSNKWQFCHSSMSLRI